MATTLTGLADIFPVGTSVGAYPAAQRHSDRAPTGSATESQSVASGGTLTYTALSSYTEYVAYALVSGQHRYVDFTTGPPTGTPDLGDPGTNWATDKEVEDAIYGLKSDLSLFNVKDPAYGATGDGATDDTAAIQATVDAAGNGIVYLPPGTYKYTNLNLPVLGDGGMVFMGAGAGATVLSQTGSGYGVTIGDGGATDTRYISIEGIELSGNASASGGVRFYTTRFCGLRRCQVRNYTNASGIGVYISDQGANYFNVLEDCHFDTNTIHVKLHGHSSGVGANSNYLNRCHFSLASGAEQVYIAGGDTNRITDCEFADAQALSILIDGTALQNEIRSCQFDGPTKAWNVSASTVTNTRLVENTGSTAIAASTDSGTDTHRTDLYTSALAQVHVYNASNASITSGSMTTLNHNTEVFDPAGFHSTSSNTDRLTVPTGYGGLYEIWGQITYPGTDVGSEVGTRELRITKNGTSPILGKNTVPANTDAAADTGVQVAAKAVLAAGDYVVLRTNQDSGSTLTAQGGNTTGTQFYMRRLPS